MFCEHFKALVSSHLASCGECRKSLTGALDFITKEIPFIGVITKRMGIDVNDLKNFTEGLNNGRTS